MNEAVADRAVGVLLGTACGDALGAGYEFGPPLASDVPVDMIGGGVFGFSPGEWTDDTSMAVCVAEAVAAGHDLRSSEGLDAVAAGFLRWFDSRPTDVGNQTAAVLSSARTRDANGLVAAAAHYFDHHPGGSAGNGSLMRTAPVALAHLDDDPAAVAEAAVRVSRLTHADPACGEACALWSVAIHHAVRHGTFDGVREGLGLLPAHRRTYWAGLLDEAEAKPPAHFVKNGWVVHALQAAWSAITHTPVPSSGDPAEHLRLALETAVRGGRDTDTVAAIAGGLLGARWGGAAVPQRWRSALFGWPGYRADDLTRLALAAIGDQGEG
ncbi:MAG TPA: ADP-ribosylglycohydrolase family protein [Micromonosporaceae bacterium]